MQISKFTAIIIAILLISACTASKRSTKTTTVASVPSTPAKVQENSEKSKEVAPSTPPSAPVEVTFPLNPFATTPQEEPLAKVYAPRQEELAAIQQQFPQVTMEKLAKGYDIYAKGACTNCHKPKSINQFSETEWKAIIIDMAQKARMSEEQEKEVYLYVLSIKATQSK
jgi:hypothetical protein